MGALAGLLPMLINLLLPVAVSEVKAKIADNRKTDATVAIEETPVVTTKEAAIPALQAVVAGAVVSKTAWFSVALLVLGFLEQNQQLLSNFVPPQYLGLVISGIGFVSLLLRATTTTSLVEKADSSPQD